MYSIKPLTKIDLINLLTLFIMLVAFGLVSGLDPEVRSAGYGMLFVVSILLGTANLKSKFLYHSFFYFLLAVFAVLLKFVTV